MENLLNNLKTHSTDFLQKHPYRAAAIGASILGAIAIKRRSQGKLNKHRQQLIGKTIIVTGGTSGIGRQAALYFYNLGADVIITGRNVKAAEKLIESLSTPQKSQAKLRFFRVDFSDLAEIQSFAETILRSYEKLDILVNNAGLFKGQYGLTKQGVEMIIGVNHLAPAYLTSLLFPLLGKGQEARIINVSSGAHKMVQLGGDKADAFKGDYWQNKEGEDYAKAYSSFRSYGRSKLANIWFTRALVKRIEAAKEGNPNLRNLKVVVLHPGIVDTKLARDLSPAFKVIGLFILPIFWLFKKSEWSGVQTTLHAALCPFEELQAGAYYQNCEVSKTNVHGRDPEYIDWLWGVTKEKVKEFTGHTIFEGL